MHHTTLCTTLLTFCRRKRQSAFAAPFLTIPVAPETADHKRHCGGDADAQETYDEHGQAQPCECDAE